MKSIGGIGLSIPHDYPDNATAHRFQGSFGALGRRASSPVQFDDKQHSVTILGERRRSWSVGIAGGDQDQLVVRFCPDQESFQLLVGLNAGWPNTGSTRKQIDPSDCSSPNTVAPSGKIL